MHVLVVESDLDTRDLVYHALINAGYEVSQARNVSDALRLSRLHPEISVVVADIHLGSWLSGLEMASKMRQKLDNTHYVLASGDWDMLELSCPNDVSVLRKPYGKTELLRAVRRGAVCQNEHNHADTPTEQIRRIA